MDNMEAVKLVRGRTRTGMEKAGEHVVASVLLEMHFKGSPLEDIFEIYGVADDSDAKGYVIDQAILLIVARELFFATASHQLKVFNLCKDVNISIQK